MWHCPTCNKIFKAENQWHSCALVGVESHFEGKPPLLKETFNTLMETVNTFGPMKVYAVKSGISVKVISTYIGIKVKKDHLVLEFFLPKVLEHPRVVKTFQMSKYRIVHYFILHSTADIDDWLTGLLKESYELISV